MLRYSPGNKAFCGSRGIANRPNLVAGARNGQATNYASSVLYAPHGAVTQFAMGNSVTPWFGYNSRLQLTQGQATIAYNASAYLFVEEPSWGTSNNNGNLQSAVVYAGGPASLSGLPSFTTNFGYDNVNRLTSASDSGGWSRGFQYDQWGNMWVNVGQSSGVPLAGNTPKSNVFTNNRINGSSYL